MNSKTKLFVREARDPRDYRRPREVATAQTRTQLANCALLCVYKYGQPGGWYAIVSGSIDGFASDYALVHSNPGDFASHPVRAFYATEASELTEYTDDINKCRQAVADEHNGQMPLVAVLTEQELSAAVAAVREALDTFAAGRIDGILVRRDEAGVEALESGTLLDGERVSKGDMLDDVADRLTPLTDEDVERWLRKLCGLGCSDLSMADWGATVTAIRA